MEIPRPSPKEVEEAISDSSEVEKIGEGGYKTVFKAKIRGNVEVIKAVSVPDIKGSETEKLRYRDECFARVEREVLILSRCSSPNLVRLGSVELHPAKISSDNYLLYSEEFLPGEDLTAIIANSTTAPSESEAKELMAALITAIEELWGLGFIHRDIKPANVMDTGDTNRRFVLLDLGIAFGVREIGLTWNAAFRAPPATFRYLAPEMADPNFRSNLDFRADLYTAALTTFEFAAGKHPIARDHDDLIHTVTRAIHTDPTKLGDLRPEFSADFCTLIDQMLKKKPNLRPANLPMLRRRLSTES